MGTRQPVVVLIGSGNIPYPYIMGLLRMIDNPPTRVAVTKGSSLGYTESLPHNPTQYFLATGNKNALAVRVGDRRFAAFHVKPEPMEDKRPYYQRFKRSKY